MKENKIETKSIVFNSDNIVLNNVFHISYLGASLISMGILQQDRDQLQDCSSRVSIIKNSRELFREILTGTNSTLYYIQCAVELGRQNAYLSKKSTIQLWYQRLEHLNLMTINSM